MRCPQLLAAMTYFDFNLSSEVDKLGEIWANGVLIAERQTGLYKYELYQIEDYYVEQVSHLHWNIRKIAKTFKTIAYLDPYLSSIDISAIAIVPKY